jgi:hypothetical protein
MAQFKYYNDNPYRIEEEDCVCRALSKALKLQYSTAENLLNMSAEHNNCDTLCVCCYNHLLEDVFNLPVRHPLNWERVGDIADLYPNNTVIIRIEGHLTMAENGVVYDLWDCRQRLVDKYWIVS